ncbi:DUF6228 family protein [Streptomyces sp. 3N207]|uniref:DUF6228 family protein n=1 Tax=Streptomyces sp. 3N207 TaxID=3457417 RepID=UPI003FD00B5B
MTIRCQDNRSVGVRFCDRFSFDEDSVHYAVEAWAPGLTARVDEVVAWIRDSDLALFPEQLAADYAGRGVLESHAPCVPRRREWPTPCPCQSE